MNNDDLFYQEKPSDNQTSSNPSGQNTGSNPYMQGDPYREAPEAPQNTKNTLATVSLVCGILSFCSCCCPYVSPLFGIAAVITAICSKKHQPMKGTAIAGLVLGAIGLAISAVFLFFIFNIAASLTDPDAYNKLIEQYPQYKDQIDQIYQQLQQQMQTDTAATTVAAIKALFIH